MTEFIERDAKEVFEEEFLDFAGYNLQRRALPDARDGLKWGARKLLHSQMLGKLTHDKPFKKAIKSVSQAMGFSYTHGNASAYGTYIRMAKPFAYRIPLQEANGNYGTLINPDDHSADRYVELRGSEIASILLKDLEKDTITEWEDTYDMEGKFPKVLPAKGFWNGVNGCISIGSGMSSSLPPLNLREVNEAMIKLLWNRNIPFEDICCFPDFPTGATILNRQEVFESLKKGRGSACKIRAAIEYDSPERCFIVKELPYSVYTNTICKELANIMDSDERNEIKDFCDYTKQEPDLRIYLAKKANPDRVLKQLYKETSLQNYFSINMTVLDKGITPVVMGQKELFLAHLDHEVEVYTRGFQYDLKKIKARLHIIEGLLKAISMIDEVVKTIKYSKDTKEANANLRKLLLIDEEQAKAILDIKLSRLAHLEVNKLEAEKSNLESEKNHVEAVLNDSTLLKKEIEKGLREVAEKFGDARRTKILDLQEDVEGETIEVKKLSVSFTNKGNVIATETSTLLAQRRNTVGTKFKLSKGEFIVDSVIGDNVDEILFFTDCGNFYHCSMGAFDAGEKVNLNAILPLNDKEAITAATVLTKESQSGSILFLTRHGFMKKSSLLDYNLVRGNGAKAISLEEGDRVVAVMTGKIDTIGILTKAGNFAIMNAESVREMGRVTKGVAAMKLDDDDVVVAAHPILRGSNTILSVSSEGLAKRTLLTEFVETKRGAKGRRIQVGDNFADFVALSSERTINVVGTATQITVAVDDVPLKARNTTGVKLLKLKDDEKVQCLCL